MYGRVHTCAKQFPSLGVSKKEVRCAQQYTIRRQPGLAQITSLASGGRSSVGDSWPMGRISHRLKPWPGLGEAFLCPGSRASGRRAGGKRLKQQTSGETFTFSQSILSRNNKHFQSLYAAHTLPQNIDPSGGYSTTRHLDSNARPSCRCLCSSAEPTSPENITRYRVPDYFFVEKVGRKKNTRLTHDLMAPSSLYGVFKSVTVWRKRHRLCS